MVLSKQEYPHTLGLIDTKISLKINIFSRETFINLLILEFLMNNLILNWGDAIDNLEVGNEKWLQKMIQQWKLQTKSLME